MKKTFNPIKAINHMYNLDDMLIYKRKQLKNIYNNIQYKIDNNIDCKKDFILYYKINASINSIEADLKNPECYLYYNV